MRFFSSSKFFCVFVKGFVYALGKSSVFVERVKTVTRAEGLPSQAHPPTFPRRPGLPRRNFRVFEFSFFFSRLVVVVRGVLVVWFGLVWFGLVWFGLVSFRVVSFRFVPLTVPGMPCFCLDSCVPANPNTRRNRVTPSWARPAVSNLYLPIQERGDLRVCRGRRAPGGLEVGSEQGMPVGRGDVCQCRQRRKAGGERARRRKRKTLGDRASKNGRAFKATGSTKLPATTARHVCSSGRCSQQVRSDDEENREQDRVCVLQGSVGTLTSCQRFSR